MKTANLLIAQLITTCTLFFTVSSLATANDQTVYKVAHINQAGVLNVRQKPGKHAPVVLQVPANSRWILKRTAERSGRWQKVVWGVKEGWVYDYYLGADKNTSEQLAAHRRCVANNRNNAICCGYENISSTNNQASINRLIKTYRIRNVPKGQSLNVRTQPGARAAKISTIPHNATGIVKFHGKTSRKGNVVWQKVRWNGKDGWVNAAYLEYDPIVSDYRNIVHNLCGSQATL